MVELLNTPSLPLRREEHANANANTNANTNANANADADADVKELPGIATAALPFFILIIASPTQYQLLYYLSTYLPSLVTKHRLLVAGLFVDVTGCLVLPCKCFPASTRLTYPVHEMSHLGNTC